MSEKINASRAMKLLREVADEFGNDHVAAECRISVDHEPVCIVGHVLFKITGEDGFYDKQNSLPSDHGRNLSGMVREPFAQAGVELTPAAHMVLGFAQSVQDGRGGHNARWYEVRRMSIAADSKVAWGTVVGLTSDFWTMYVQDVVSDE